MDILDIEEALEVCADYLREAGRVQEMFSSDVTMYLVKAGVLTLAGGTLCLAAATVAVSAGNG